MEGDASGVYRDTFELSHMYDRNLDYVVSEAVLRTEEATEEE